MEETLIQFYLQALTLLQNSGISISPELGRMVALSVGIFIFALLLGVTRRHMLIWSIHGAWFGIVLGIIMTLIIQAFLLVGGRTAVVEVVKNQKTPQVVRSFLEENITELAHSLAGEPKTLGAAQEKNPRDFILEFQGMSPDEQEKVRNTICKP